MLLPINFQKWIDEHRHLLKPPVGNQVVYQDTEFIIMVVGGPNVRKDYHVNKGEEFFYQLEGNMVLKIREKGKSKDIPINEGEIFLLSPNIPHSPQRYENTVGLVVERKRHEGELDGFQWYCEKCNGVLYNKYIELTDIVKQLPPLFKEFWNNKDARTCHHCNAFLEEE